MKKCIENMYKKCKQNIFYKTNPRGISLIVLVITIIVVIILAAAVIISLQNNNPMVEANKARINSDVANMQMVFTNTVGKIMAENQDVVVIKNGQLNAVTSGVKKTDGVAKYEIKAADGNVVEGNIMFKAGNKEGTTYYTGKELPIYNSETKWYVDEQGLVSVEVGGVLYGEGSKSDNLPVEEGEEIVASDNPKLQSWTDTSTTDFHNPQYRDKITKIRFATNVKVPNSKIESWDVSEAKDVSVMSWVENDGNEGYILTIAGKEKIIANSNSSYLFYDFSKVKEIENMNFLDTSNLVSLVFMFDGCSNLTSVDLSNFDTTNVISFGSLFHDCSSLTRVDLSNFNTSNVTNMTNMFLGCSSLTSLDLSNFDTSKVENMQSMFNNCKKLENINISNFNFDNAKDTMMMFYQCNNLTTTINIKSNKIENYTSMFDYSPIISPAKITVNYTVQSSSIVDSMIATKSASSNVVKGIQVE